MPYTYALDAARQVLLTGRSLASPTVLTDLVVLMLYMAVSLPLGLRVFRWGYNRIRAEGTVATY
jgi:hypothetical protein